MFLLPYHEGLCHIFQNQVGRIFFHLFWEDCFQLTVYIKNYDKASSKLLCEVSYSIDMDHKWFYKLMI